MTPGATSISLSWATIVPLAQRPPAGQAPGLPPVEVAQDLGRVEAVGDVIDVGPVLEARVQRRAGGAVPGVGLGRGAAVARPRAAPRPRPRRRRGGPGAGPARAAAGSEAVAIAPPASSRLRLIAPIARRFF